MAGSLSATAVCGLWKSAPSITSAHSINSESGDGSQPNFSRAMRARKRVQLFAVGSQNFFPLLSARNAASSDAVSKALWWWSNHQVRRGSAEKRKSTTAFSSPEKTSSPKSCPAR